MYVVAEWAMAHNRIALHEIVWFSLGVIGFCVNVWGWRDSRKDIVSIEELGKNGWLKRIAIVQMKANRDRTFVNLAVMVIGIAAMAQKPPSNGDTVTVLTLVITVGLYVIVSVSTINPIRQRKLKLDYLKQLKDEAESERM